MKELFKQQASTLQEKLYAIRQHLHANPELSFEEFETMAFVGNELKKIGIPFQDKIAGTGLVAIIEGGKPGKCIALRADMDALPIDEKNEVPYKSRNEGVMHACGHDVHTTCLLGAAEILWKNRAEISGTIKLIFQPGEEKSPGGASLMIKEGVLLNPKPDAILGLHVFPDLPAGFVGFRSGQYMASADEIHITIKGKGGHAALPQNTIDPIVIAANIIVQLQQIVSRRNSPLTPSVLTFGKIEGGHTTNVIPEEVHLSGTFRTFDETWRKKALILLNEVVELNAKAWGATGLVNIPPGYPCLYNEEALTSQIKISAENYLGSEFVKEIPKRMTAEDFSFYSQEIPGCFFRLGTNLEDKKFLNPVHNSQFDIAESALEVGAGMMAWLAFDFLKG